MDGFYEVLQKAKGLDERQIGIIQDMFEKEEIGFEQLPRLTNEKLKEDGLTQRGLWEAILSILGK